MGDWNIEIKGRGPHHNAKGASSDDVDLLAAEFVERLQKGGHTILRADLATTERREAIRPPEPKAAELPGKRKKGKLGL